jgi:hypothetical protein
VVVILAEKTGPALGEVAVSLTIRKAWHRRYAPYGDPCRSSDPANQCPRCDGWRDGGAGGGGLGVFSNSSVHAPSGCL